MSNSRNQNEWWGDPQISGQSAWLKMVSFQFNETLDIKANRVESNRREHQNPDKLVSAYEKWVHNKTLTCIHLIPPEIYI